MYKLRPYQQQAVEGVVKYFRGFRRPGLVVLPTGAGKSLVIAELAKIAKGRVLVLAHVKELVEQNFEKFSAIAGDAGIFSAGLNRKDCGEKVIFGSIQSVARAEPGFFSDFSLLIIDECHRVSMDPKSQYHQLISKLQRSSKRLCVLGLTATPYRQGQGWIYEYNMRGFKASEQACFFACCIFELPLHYMIRNSYLTQPIKIDAPVACYDFSKLCENREGSFQIKEIEQCLKEQKRITPGIIEHIVSQAESRMGVMIFAATVRHAQEILSLIPKGQAALIVGDTSIEERNRLVGQFKDRKFKFLVNVSVLTTGFDAPHVDLIAILRPTESVSLYQQIVGRGLRLFPGKKDCLILDYTGQGHDIFAPEVSGKKPHADAQIVEVPCPECGFKNQFWGKADVNGYVIEHHGRRCKAVRINGASETPQQCEFRFRFKVCDHCGAENDITARVCHSCDENLIDPDEKLKKAMALKDSHVMKPDAMYFASAMDKKQRPRLEVTYADLDGNCLKEFHYLQGSAQMRAFYYKFVRMHLKAPGFSQNFKGLDHIVSSREKFRLPLFVVARKKKYFWEIREKIFDI
ncbi:MAG: DEAD/DEAH box helicase [Oligoflexales bacterium]|nr:DEAD/DEAH box helicase [Oligoflexales bacterium]